MEIYLRDRRAHFHDGMSSRAIARDFRISHDSVAKMLSYSEPPGHAQADIGEALVVIGGVEQKAYYFAFDLPYSDAGSIRGLILLRTQKPGLMGMYSFWLFWSSPAVGPLR